MYTYAFMNDYGLSPPDVESVLARIGLTGAAVQILHYSRPRVVLIMVDKELSATERQQLQEGIASIRGTDPVPPTS